MVKGTSTAAQRELVRQDVIAYVSKNYPRIKLNEGLYAFTDANGNRTDDENNAVDFGNSGFESGAGTYEYTQLLRNYNTYTVSELANMLREDFYNSVDGEVDIWGISSNYNIVIYKGVGTRIKTDDIVDWVMVMCTDRIDPDGGGMIEEQFYD